jgi:hypothetical protein
LLPTFTSNLKGPAAQSISDASSTAHVAILVAALTVIGTVLAAILGPIVSDMIGRARQRNNDSAVEDQKQTDRSDKIQEEMANVAATLRSDKEFTREWREEHSMTDKELQRQFDSIKASLVSQQALIDELRSQRFKSDTT